ncbi:MAG: GH25 family lysozyme [Verrucomicrobiota bacterium]|jgi:GH25 family lysozyme M1 (1,4-beta-N-acetylmuramidase)
MKTAAANARRRRRCAPVPLRLFLPALFFLMAKPASAQRPLGTDVSHYQGAGINWTNVKNDGVSFAWAKATEGTYYFDADFTLNEANARAAGVMIGAYHYARPSDDTNLTGANSAESEAAYFWSKASNYVTGGGAYLMPMLDWEDVYVTNAGLNFTAAALSQWVNQWCNDVSNYARANGVTVRPVVYTGTWYSKPGGYPGLTTAVTNWASWIADYPSHPNPQTGAPSDGSSDPFFPWTSWNIWQYADTNWSGGDADVFNGTTNQFWQLFLVGGVNGPRITTNPPSMTVAQGSNATLSVSVSGATPLYYHWQFDGTNVAAVTNFNTNTVQYAIANVQLANAGNYAAQISNAYGTASSAPAFLSVTAPLSNAAGAVIAPAGLVNWWPANGNAIDIVSGCNGLAANGFFYAPGETGLAFHFDGSTGYLSLTNSPADVPVPWTACLWVYRQQTPQTSAALLSDGTYTLKLEQWSKTHQVGMTQSSVADWIFTNSNYTVPLQTWTHLAFVASGSGAGGLTTLYVNGAQEGILNTTIPLGRTTLGATYVSSTDYVDYLEGAMDEVMIFNRALTAAQIQSIYSAGASGLVQAPQFLGLTPVAGGNWTLNLEGLTGRNFTIDSSTDLIRWSALATLGNPGGTVLYTDTNAGSSPATFYRAIQP